MKTILCLLLCSLNLIAADPPKTPDRTAMYEDVEVLRRLIGNQFTTANTNYAWVMQDRALLTFSSTGSAIRMWDPTPAVVGSTSTLPYQIGLVGSQSTTQPYMSSFISYGYPHQSGFVLNDIRPRGFEPPTVEGNYIKGVGVVYSLKMMKSEAQSLHTPKKSALLASNCSKCHGEAMAKKIEAPPEVTKKAATDPWESTLNALRGIEEKPVPVPPTHLTTEEVCLPGNLSETVLNLLTNYGSRFRDLAATDSWTVVVTLLPDSGAALQVVPGVEYIRSRFRAADEQVALGDLHAKQNKHLDAISAYQKAIELLSQPMKFPEETVYDHVKGEIEAGTKSLRSIQGKMAQSSLALGKLDEAKAAIEKAKSAGLRIEAMPKPAVTPTKEPLPMKLTVTITKKAIDDHKAGKSTLAELRSSAEIEAIGFATSTKKTPPK